MHEYAFSPIEKIVKLIEMGDYNGAIKIAKELVDNARKSGDEELILDALDLLAAVYNDIGGMLGKMCRYDEAEKYYLEAMGIRRELAQICPERFLLSLSGTCSNIGMIYVKLGRLSDAEKYYLEAMEIREKLAEQDPETYLPKLADTYNSIGILYYKWRKYKEAEKYYNKAIEIRIELVEYDLETFLPKLADTYNNMAILYEAWSKYRESEQYYLETIEIRKMLAKHDPEKYLPELAKTYGNIALLYWRWGKYSEAEKYYGDALKIYKKLVKINPKTYLPDLANLYNSIGIIYEVHGRYREAEGNYLEAIKIYKELSENLPIYLSDLAMVYNNISVLYMKWWNYEKAEENYRNAMRIYEDLVKKGSDEYIQDLAMLLVNMGILYEEWGRHKEAERYYHRAMEIYEDLKEKDSEAYLHELAKIYGNLGNLYIKQGEYDRAEKHHFDAVEIIRKLSQKNPDAYMPDLAASYNNLGGLYVKWHKYDKAVEFYSKAIEIYEDLVKQRPEAYILDLAMIHNNLGGLYIIWQKYISAEKHLKEAIKIYKNLSKKYPEAIYPKLAKAYNNMGSLYLKWGKYKKAEKYLTMCGKIIFKEPYIRIVKGIPRLIQLGVFEVLIRYIHNYARLMAIRKPKASIKYYEYALYILRDFSLSIRTYDDLGRFFEEYDAVINDFVETIHKTYMETKDMSYLLQGARIMEELKFIPLLKDLSTKISSEKAAKLRDLEAKLSRILTLLHELKEKRKIDRRQVPSEKIDSLKHEVNKILEEIEELRVDIYSSVVPLQLKSLSEYLPEKSLYVFIVLTKEIRNGYTFRKPFFIWISDKYSGCGYADIDIDAIRENLFELQDTHWNIEMLRYYMDGIAEQLPEELMVALDNAASNKYTIIISPHGPTHDIPWEALDPSVVLGGNKRPISLSTLILRIYSPISLGSATRDFGGKYESLVVGVENPCPKESKCESLVLRGISDEVRYIGKLLNTEPIIINGQDEEEASRLLNYVRTQLRKAKLFYFSGHGFTINISPMSTISYLLFYKSKSKELRILPSDILLRKNVQGYIAFLNACRTGRGAEGRGILDFRGGFIHSLVLSGFEFIFVSLWSVFNRSAKIFAASLFKNLNRLGLKDAIVKARHDVLSLEPTIAADAFAFVIYGSWRHVDASKSLTLKEDCNTLK